MRTPNIIMAFSGKRPPGDIIDGAQFLLDELGDIPDDEFKTLEEIEALRSSQSQD